MQKAEDQRSPIPLEAVPLAVQLPSGRLAVKVPLHLYGATGWGPYFEHVGLWGTFQIQTTRLWEVVQLCNLHPRPLESGLNLPASA